MTPTPPALGEFDEALAEALKNIGYKNDACRAVAEFEFKSGWRACQQHMPAKIAALEAEVKGLREINSIQKLYLTAAKKNDKRLRKVLEFYATQWRADVYTGPTNELLEDFGKRARQALESEGGGG